MADSVAGVVLAAGAGARLRPLTDLLPKPLCPVANVALVDHALERLLTVVEVDGRAVDHLAVNVHHGAALIAAHLEGRVHVSHERVEALGTAGALGKLRAWLDGRDVVVVNADTWCPGGLDALVEGWDRERVRVLVSGGGGFGPRAAVVASAMPWVEVRDLRPEPTGLYEVSWRRAHDDGRLEVVAHHGPAVDCGTPRRYLQANLAASGGAPVVHPDAVVEGRLVRSVVWAGARVHRDERLVEAVRAREGGRDVTVLVR